MSDTSLQKFQEFPVVTASLSEVYTLNKTLNEKGIQKAKTLIDTIDAEGMSPEMDEEVNKTLSQLATAKDRLNTRRKPITQLFDAVAKEFTALENSLDKAKVGSVAYILQEHRDKYAKQIMIDQQQRDRELQDIQRKKAEVNTVRAEAEQKIRSRTNEVIFATKKHFNDIFNAMTLANVEETKTLLEEIPLVYDRSKYNGISVIIQVIYMKSSELAAEILLVRDALYDELCASFRENMEDLKMNLTDQLPSRVMELQEQATASADEQKRIQEAAELRQREEDNRLERERQQNEKDAADRAKMSKEMGEANLSFERDTAQADIFSTQAAVVKYSYVIQVNTPIGWQNIAALWFKVFGSKFAMDKYPKKTFESMKKELEVLAFNGGERLQDSMHLSYEKDVKAKVTK